MHKQLYLLLTSADKCITQSKVMYVLVLSHVAIRNALTYRSLKFFPCLQYSKDFGS